MSARRALRLNAQDTEADGEATICEADRDRSDRGAEETLEGAENCRDEIEDGGDQSTEGDAEEVGREKPVNARA